MKDLVKVHIVFENCDVLEVLRKHIFNFRLSDVVEKYALHANAMSIYRAAKQCHLTLDWDVCKDLEGSFGCTLRDNIEHKHICYYCLYFDDGTDVNIYVPWEGESQYTNVAENHKKWSYNGKTELLTISHGIDEE